MKILYFGVYDPNYARNWVLINGLRKNGVEVLECNDKSNGRFRQFFSLFFIYKS